ncbi:MAG: nucleoside triphosphate pyrophosphohydrolase [Bacteroidia bacterium]
MDQAMAKVARLTEIVEELREKCPWDREQTKESIRHLSIEEVYELSDAILKNDYEEIKAELGDLLLHVLFYSSLAQEKGEFTLEEMVQTQIDKLIRRHPHIYATPDQATTSDEVALNWEQIKAKERKGNEKRLTLDGVPAHLPPLIKAQRMQEKAAKMGFDWDDEKQVWDKVKEELLEFETAANEDEKEAEMGDLLFSLVNYCRFKGINPDDALSRTNQKFKTRFDYVESQSYAKGQTLKTMTLSEMDVLWDEAKAKLL